VKGPLPRQAALWFSDPPHFHAQPTDAHPSDARPSNA
jgi:hypothetical protein